MEGAADQDRVGYQWRGCEVPPVSGWNLPGEGPGEQFAERLFPGDRVGEKAADVLVLVHRGHDEIAPDGSGQVRDQVLVGAAVAEGCFQPLDVWGGYGG